MGIFGDIYDATREDFRNAQGLNDFVGKATAPFTGNFGNRAGTVDPEDAAAYGQQKPQGLQRNPDPANVQQAKATGDAVDAKYFKSGPSTVPPAGVNMFGAGGSNGPIGGNDEYRKMADQLYGLSQQRAGTEGSIGTNGYMQQLNNIRALRDMTPTGGVGILGEDANGMTEIDRQNAEKTRRWAIDDLKVSPDLKAKLLTDMYNHQDSNLTARRGQDLNYNSQLSSQGVQMRGQDLHHQGQMAGLDTQRRGQDMTLQGALSGQANQGRIAQMQALSHLLGIDMQGDNQVGLENLRQNSPLAAAQAEEAKARSGLYGVQKEGAQKQLEFDRSFDGSVQKYASMFIKDGGMPPDQAIAMALKMAMGGRRAAEQHANGGIVGYADGGEVEGKETAEQILARMHAKYGVPAAGAEAQQPAPQPQPQPQQQAPAPRQETWSEKLRRMATGGLEQRMRGYAEGGPINVGGRQVLGEGDGKSDSLPAVIDGERPAALSTGEFVMPVEAVQHFGLDRLNKMVAAARKGLDTGR